MNKQKINFTKGGSPKVWNRLKSTFSGILNSSSLCSIITYLRWKRITKIQYVHSMVMKSVDQEAVIIIMTFKKIKEMKGFQHLVYDYNINGDTFSFEATYLLWRSSKTKNWDNQKYQIRKTNQKIILHSKSKRSSSINNQ